MTATFGPEWTARPGASKVVLESLQKECGRPLPEGYLELLGLSDGGEGPLGAEPGWLQLWPASDVMRLNRDYEIDRAIPGFVGIGSSGGGELISLDFRASAPYPVVMIPFIPMDAAKFRLIAEDVESFRRTALHT